jgi:hypothetical protein
MYMSVRVQYVCTCRHVCMHVYEIIPSSCVEICAIHDLDAKATSCPIFKPLRSVFAYTEVYTPKPNTFKRLYESVNGLILKKSGTHGG